MIIAIFLTAVCRTTEIEYFQEKIMASPNSDHAWGTAQSSVRFRTRKSIHLLELVTMVPDKVALKLPETLNDLCIEREALHDFRHTRAREIIDHGEVPSGVQRQMSLRDSRTALQNTGT